MQMYDRSALDEALRSRRNSMPSTGSSRSVRLESLKHSDQKGLNDSVAAQHELRKSWLEESVLSQVPQAQSGWSSCRVLASPVAAEWQRDQVWKTAQVTRDFQNLTVPKGIREDQGPEPLVCSSPPRKSKTNEFPFRRHSTESLFNPSHFRPMTSSMSQGVCAV
mmetsp:Transcript_31580/g.49476  ORF Transcript_31580/g.49476 Transcript_31580/m.49476 type:complete len:164 (-) Transcript_31580:149-640(-)